MIATLAIVASLIFLAIGFLAILTRATNKASRASALITVTQSEPTWQYVAATRTASAHFTYSR